MTVLYPEKTAVARIYDEKCAWLPVGFEIARREAIRLGNDPETVDANDANRYASLANRLHRGVIDSSPTLRRALGLRAGKRSTLAFRYYDRERFEHVRDRIDTFAADHPEGREGWLDDAIELWESKRREKNR